MKPLCLFMWYFLVHAFSPSHSYNTFIRRPPVAEVPVHLLTAAWSAQRENPSWGAEPRIELGSALQQADALPSELSRTFWTKMHTDELRRTLLSYATLYWATPHPPELRRTLWATPHPAVLRRTLTALRRTLWATPQPSELRG